jgi:hypothetical protein
MGLRPDTAFGCALDFLLRPKQEVLDGFGAELQVQLVPKRCLPFHLSVCLRQEILSGSVRLLLCVRIKKKQQPVCVHPSVCLPAWLRGRRR